LIDGINQFVEELNEAVEELDDVPDNDTPLVFIELEQHTLLVSGIRMENGNIYISAGKSAGRFGE
jgi:hypothetical protein